MTHNPDLALNLINRFQHGMPICARPYQAMADILDCSEQDVLDCLDMLHHSEILSRVGPVFNHQRAGASTLAALSVPAHRLDEVAKLVSQYHEVNHNYERDGDWNLWFVITAPDAQRLKSVLVDIKQRTGLQPLNLPMITPFHIDLGFPLDSLNPAGGTP